MRWTYRFEMRYLLEASGFEVAAEYSDFRQPAANTPPNRSGSRAASIDAPGMPSYTQSRPDRLGLRTDS